MALSLMAFQSAKRMPYTAVNNPAFIAASAATFLAANDRLIVLTAAMLLRHTPRPFSRNTPWFSMIFLQDPSQLPGDPTVIRPSCSGRIERQEAAF
jgi:hypothetical protein